MLYMITERFGVDGAGLAAVADRFARCGRMIPEGSGVSYVASWMGSDGSLCYQLMLAPDRAALDAWIANWSDLVGFEVVEVEPSAEFWERWRRTSAESRDR